MTITNNTKTITDCNIKNVKALYPLCDVAIDVLDNHKTSVKASDLKAAGVVESLEGIQKTAGGIYDTANKLRVLRESVGISGANCDDTDSLHNTRETEQKLRALCATWFTYFGKRNPRTEKGSDRPLYSLTNADLLTLGAECQSALTETKGNTSKVYTVFLVHLLKMTARILKGEPFMTLPEGELEKIKAAAAEAAAKRAEKAAETRKKNEVKKAAERAARVKEKAEFDQLKAETEEARKNVLDRELMVAAINAMPLTFAQKRLLLDCSSAVKNSAEAAIAWTQVKAMTSDSATEKDELFFNQGTVVYEYNEVV